MAKDQQTPRKPTTDKPKKEKKEKKKKAKKPQHPIVLALQPNQFLDAVPADFDFERHAPIKGKTFGSKAAFFEYRAAELTFKADRFRTQAAQDRQFGDKATRQAASRLQKMQSKMAEMTALLKAQGVDVESILKAAVAPTAKS